MVSDPASRGTVWRVTQLAGVQCGLVGPPAVIVGGMDMMSQAVMLAKKPHVVIGE